MALDQWGNAVFESKAAGRAAKAQLQRNGDGDGDKTIPEMLKGYAVDDYTDKANTDAYAQSVYAVGDSQGVDLRGKKIKDLSPKEFEALLDGMKNVEGFQEGSVTRTQPRANTGPEALNPEQQRVHQMATQALGSNWAPRTHRNRSTPSPARPQRSRPRTPGVAMYRACS